MARVMERTATRARVPLRYSQGYNPRPQVALLCPRPVAVSACEDPLLLRTDEPIKGDILRDGLNARAPSGLEFVRVDQQVGRRTPLPVRMRYACPVADEPTTRRRLAHLRARRAWPVERLVSVKGRRRGRIRRTVDLRQLVEDVDVHDGRLRWTAVRAGDLWARPGEVLRVAGLEEQPALASVVRTRVELDDSGERPTEQDR
jgi:radical SAM-linked protein